MPEPPPGEADLRALAERFSEAETRIRALVARSVEGSRRDNLTEALDLLGALRGEDFRGPVGRAYEVARRDGASKVVRARSAPQRESRRARPEAKVDDLARSLHRKLDRGIQTVEANVRKAIPKVTADNLEEMTAFAVTAYIDRGRTLWTLSSWAAMTTETIGRQASSRGTIDGVGKGRKVVVDVGECELCNSLFSGELVVGEDPLPPGHPGCTCVASAA